MKQKQISLIIAILLLNIYKKTWRELPKYYKSMAYASFINAFYYYLFKRHLLWEFNPGGLNWRFLRKMHIFLVTPLLVLLCLSHFPESFFKRVIHVLKWVLSASFIEYGIARNHMIRFKYGWNTFWSGIMYLQMLVYSYLFIKRPFLTLILSLCSILFYMLKFKLPLSKRFLKGPYFLFCKKTRYPFENKVENIIFPYYLFLKGKCI